MPLTMGPSGSGVRTYTVDLLDDEGKPRARTSRVGYRDSHDRIAIEVAHREEQAFDAHTSRHEFPEKRVRVVCDGVGYDYFLAARAENQPAETLDAEDGSGTYTVPGQVNVAYRVLRRTKLPGLLLAMLDAVPPDWTVYDSGVSPDGDIHVSITAKGYEFTLRSVAGTPDFNLEHGEKVLPVDAEERLRIVAWVASVVRAATDLTDPVQWVASKNVLIDLDDGAVGVPWNPAGTRSGRMSSGDEGTANPPRPALEYDDLFAEATKRLPAIGLVFRDGLAYTAFGGQEHPLYDDRDRSKHLTEDEVRAKFADAMGSRPVSFSVGGSLKAPLKLYRVEGDGIAGTAIQTAATPEDAAEGYRQRSGGTVCYVWEVDEPGMPEERPDDAITFYRPGPADENDSRFIRALTRRGDAG